MATFLQLPLEIKEMIVEHLFPTAERDNWTLQKKTKSFHYD
jgi:hypothetical protein